LYKERNRGDHDLSRQQCQQGSIDEAVTFALSVGAIAPLAVGCPLTFLDLRRQQRLAWIGAGLWAARPHQPPHPAFSSVKSAEATQFPMKTLLPRAAIAPMPAACPPKSLHGEPWLCRRVFQQRPGPHSAFFFQKTRRKHKILKNQISPKKRPNHQQNLLVEGQLHQKRL
jgi:hypothetical protein